MAAHATATNANASAHHAQGGAQGAASGDDGTLFADLLARSGNAGDATTKPAADPKDAANAGKTHGKAKNAKDDATDTLANLVEMQALPQHMAALNAKFATQPGAPKSKTDKTGDAVNAADVTDAASDAAQVPAETQDSKAPDTKADGQTIPAKDAGKKPTTKDVVAAEAKDDAAADATNIAVPAPIKDSAKSEKAMPGKTAKIDVLAAADAAQAADTAATDPTGGKAPTVQPDDAKDNAAKDAQTPVPDKAAALATVADKSVRDNASSQGSQARALPVHLEAQVAASQTNNDSKPGNDGDNAKDASPSPHAKTEAASAPRQDAVQPATAQGPQNTADTSPSPSQTQNQTANVQPVGAQAPAQNAPAVTASVQVAQQTAAQPGTGPDIGALAVQIAAKSSEGTKHFDIRLDPPELGRVDVKLSIDSSGQAQAHLTVEKPQTLDLMQRDRSDLERALKNSGVDLSQSGLNFSLKGQDRQGGDNSTPFRGRSQHLVATAAIESVSAAVAASANSFAAGDTRLDIRV